MPGISSAVLNILLTKADAERPCRTLGSRIAVARACPSVSAVVCSTLIVVAAQVGFNAPVGLCLLHFCRPRVLLPSASIECLIQSTFDGSILPLRSRTLNLASPATGVRFRQRVARRRAAGGASLGPVPQRFALGYRRTAEKMATQAAIFSCDLQPFAPRLNKRSSLIGWSRSTKLRTTLSQSARILPPSG